ncbi:MAG TPA: hypothetical protein VM935_05020 [Chitinophagaceae bacterium]|nr:hypothetical protein [Chitinophagaceae bacterium]
MSCLLQIAAFSYALPVVMGFIIILFFLLGEAATGRENADQP